MPEGEKTIITKATTTSKSLRATIPMGIVKQFDLKEGDKLAWKIEAKEDKLVIVVTSEKS